MPLLIVWLAILSGFQLINQGFKGSFKLESFRYICYIAVAYSRIKLLSIVAIRL